MNRNLTLSSTWIISLLLSEQCPTDTQIPVIREQERKLNFPLISEANGENAIECYTKLKDAHTLVQYTQMEIMQVPT